MGTKALATFFEDQYRLAKEVLDPYDCFSNEPDFQRLIPSLLNPNSQRFFDAYQRLPSLSVTGLLLDQDIVTICTDPLDDEQAEQLKGALMGASPWRKGPFQVGPVLVDTEWRSNLKWDRIQPVLPSLKGKRVLDIGCGSGYYMARLAGLGADLVLGVDPSPLFWFQFLMMQQYAQCSSLAYLPLRMEALSIRPAAFDVILCLGVLYHRRSLLECLSQLKKMMGPDTVLVLETLVLEGDHIDYLLPGPRYAKMPNVYYIPTLSCLKVWLHQAGFSSVECASVSVTDHEEQRQTEWMTYESLGHFLDPKDGSLTVEGWPAPRRAVLKVSL
ncbi:MAG: tRNA 5-methoxyuridine(34)/uridine 5-oxyacetic acid(34) synthase CmoB [Actinobacteria bacterium]|nr:tRNA 5-methoxyuridine(34)/uridine 5-oxyacetic acid(34) synthase CmoB [Actinomycetota bacterium]